MKVHEKRIRRLNEKDELNGPVLYWMDRDMRMNHNWAFLFAQEKAKEKDAPIFVVYNLVADFLGGGGRQRDFKLRGLKELEASFQEKGIPFYVLLTDESSKDLVKLIEDIQPSLVVTDFSPLRIQRKWKREVAKEISTVLYEVDAHNIVPVWEASPKKEFAAYTFRPKIKALLPEFLTTYPYVLLQKEVHKKKFPKTDWKRLNALDTTDELLEEKMPSGETAARNMLDSFLQSRLNGYAEKRNDPTVDMLSGLSPYLHYGQISAQFIAHTVMKKAGFRGEDKKAFLEELIVRRELSDNFCFYEKKYDSFAGFPDWAKETLDEHRKDKREYVYTKRQFEQAKTHDDAWNAAQIELLKTGKMHGYMRMYWAKKILEWTKSPEDALKIALYLNDKYEMDGRDPNGYVGCVWSIGGVHDRAWFERDIFGKIRFMNQNGLKRKFDLDAYIKKYVV